MRILWRIIYPLAIVVILLSSLAWFGKANAADWELAIYFYWTGAIGCAVISLALSLASVLSRRLMRVSNILLTVLCVAVLGWVAAESIRKEISRRESQRFLRDMEERSRKAEVEALEAVRRRYGTLAPDRAAMFEPGGIGQDTPRSEPDAQHEPVGVQEQGR